MIKVRVSGKPNEVDSFVEELSTGRFRLVERSEPYENYKKVKGVRDKNQPTGEVRVYLSFIEK